MLLMPNHATLDYPHATGPTHALIATAVKEAVDVAVNPDDLTCVVDALRKGALADASEEKVVRVRVGAAAEEEAVKEFTATFVIPSDAAHSIDAERNGASDS